MSLLALGLSAAVVGRARGDLLGLWLLDEVPGATVVTNAATGGTNGILRNGVSWVVDSDHGRVMSFDGTNDYVDAGVLPVIPAAQDFTWAFWARSEQGVNSDVILGNRFGGANNAFIKFTPNKFEYRAPGINDIGDIDYADIPRGQWIHHMVVKTGNTVTYYRDGSEGGTNTVVGDAPALPFTIGGDQTAEYWQGRVAEVAVWNEALDAAQRRAVIAGDYRAWGLEPAMFTEVFSGSVVDSNRWDTVNKGLESTVDGGYDPPSVSGGVLALRGTTTHSYWAGRSLRSVAGFHVPPDGELIFQADRISLAGTGTGYRSSLWMWNAAGNYMHFSQDIEVFKGWSYNADNQNPTGSGAVLGRTGGVLATNLGTHTMMLKNDGAFTKVYLDGTWLKSQTNTFTQGVHLMLTGQARQSGDTVTSVFDNVSITTRTFDLEMYDDFNTGIVDPSRWDVIQKGLEKTGLGGATNIVLQVEGGELLIEGRTGVSFWSGMTLRSKKAFPGRVPKVFLVDRDRLCPNPGDSAVRSSLWLWADDDNWLMFAQNIGENGFSYNYNEDGGQDGNHRGAGVNIASLDALDSDTSFHEMGLRIAPQSGGSGTTIEMLLDGSVVASRTFGSAFAQRSFHFMLSGMPRDADDSVSVGFDNVRMLPTAGTLLTIR